MTQIKHFSVTVTLLNDAMPHGQKWWWDYDKAEASACKLFDAWWAKHPDAIIHSVTPSPRRHAEGMDVRPETILTVVYS